MSYSTDHLRTAGKITVYSTFIGVVVFAFIFIFNIGETKINKVVAQTTTGTATTSVIVVNTPPSWTATATEAVESSSNNPTNAGDVVTWTAIGTDSNGEDYWLLICDNANAPTATSNGAPTCNGGVQWAVSATTSSGAEATAATTTLDGWAESNDWYAWVCDGNVGTPRCSVDYTQGTHATNSSPFEVNHRPSFTVFNDTSPGDPGTVVTFTSTSSDTDTSGAADTVRLFVCATAGFDTALDTCTGITLASTTVGAASDASASYTIIVPTQDQDYGAYGYVIDNHGFEATGGQQGQDTVLTVSNVAPTVASSTISLVQPVTTDIILAVEAGETTGLTLEFYVSDSNSCMAAGGGAGSEITDYNLSIYRSGVGSTTCAVTGPYNANFCYPSSVAPVAWGLSCTASSTTCIDENDEDILYECTFPLWYIADPTGSVQTQYPAENWLAQVQAIDDGQDGNLASLTGPLSESESGVDVEPLLAFALNTLSIAYGSLEPGQQNDPLSATTTVSATGNVGLDKDVVGESMCEGYTQMTPCAPSDTSTIPASEQRFTATSSSAYADATPLSSTTPQLIDINVQKSTATATQAFANAYWGIRVPASITYAGEYTGHNTFTAVLSDPDDWD